MLHEQKPFEQTGELKEGPEKNELILSLVNFVEESLLLFAKELENLDIENEPGLTQEFCDLLNDYIGKRPYWFHSEDMQDTSNGNSPRIDIGVKTRKLVVINSVTYKRRKTFFSWEAKRLGLTGKRKNEYVIGRKEKGKHKTCGGIERFKKGIHGKNLNYAGLIGYVQKESFDYWYEQINIWIDELITINTSWQKDDKLKLEKGYPQKVISKYKSINLRIKSKPITLFHLWVKMN